jgi:hypothetical protein
MHLQLAMIRKTRAIFSLLLCLNMLAVSFYGSVINISDSFHVMTTHQAAIDHHHHDSFSLHMDHDDVSMVHQHVGDYAQNIAVLCDNNLSIPLLEVSQVHLTRLELPTSAFIKTPFRPPQLHA